MKELQNPQFIIDSLIELCNNKSVDTSDLFHEILKDYNRKKYLSNRQIRYLKTELPKYKEYIGSIGKSDNTDDSVHLTLCNSLIIKNTPDEILQQIKKDYTITNPKWQENKWMRRWNGNTPKYLEYFEVDEDLLYLPIGATEHIKELLHNNKTQYTETDNTYTNPAAMEFIGELKDFQAIACEEVLEHNTGTLIAPTGAGKTVCGLYVIGERKQVTLVVVHTKELLYQWIDRANTFLGLDKESIGILGDGQFKVGKELTIGLVQTCVNKIDLIKNKFGMVVVDEAHKAPSAQFLKVVHFMKARYKLGLTATYKRRDKLHKIIFWTLGNIRHEVDKDALIKDGHIVMPYFKMINTEFRTTVKDVQNNYSKMLAELTRDQDRNNQIVDDINTIEGKTCLIISDRKKHVLDMWNLLMYKYNKTGEVLIGDTKQKDRKRIVKRVNTGKCKWLFATGQLIGEGFDCKNLDYLFICTPIKWSGRLTQYIGRIMRPGDGEDRPVVYDYVDQHVDVLVKSSKARSKVYGTKNII